MNQRTRRFACTQCGNCCNRSPEVELSEAAGLADIFVFRLMFRLYRQARVPMAGNSKSGSQAFYEKKRLLRAHAAHTYESGRTRDRSSGQHIHYLMISALTLNTRKTECAALSSSQCSVYERRPLTCKTVPFHYRRTDSAAERDFDAFVSTPGYSCDTSERAPLVLDSGLIVHPQTREARLYALRLAKQDLAWKQAIVRAMRSSDGTSIPSLRDVEANSAFGAMTTSMRVAWQIGVQSEILEGGDLQRLIRIQLQTIDRELENGLASPDDRQSLREMRAEYAEALNG